MSVVVELFEAVEAAAGPAVLAVLAAAAARPARGRTPAGPEADPGTGVAPALRYYCFAGNP